MGGAVETNGRDFHANPPSPPGFNLSSVHLMTTVVFAVFCVISVLGRVGPSVLHVGQGGLRWAIVARCWPFWVYVGTILGCWGAILLYLFLMLKRRGC